MVGYLRNEDGASLPGALIDAWLLQAFPGRTLDELDGMDWPRYLRARQAQNMEAVEKVRRMRLAKQIEDKDIESSTWEAIKRHDQLIAAHGQADQ